MIEADLHSKVIFRLIGKRVKDQLYAIRLPISKSSVSRLIHSHLKEVTKKVKPYSDPPLKIAANIKHRHPKKLSTNLFSTRLSWWATKMKIIHNVMSASVQNDIVSTSQFHFHSKIAARTIDVQNPEQKVHRVLSKNAKVITRTLPKRYVVCRFQFLFPHSHRHLTFSATFGTRRKRETSSILNDVGSMSSSDLGWFYFYQNRRKWMGDRYKSILEERLLLYIATRK